MSRVKTGCVAFWRSWSGDVQTQINGTDVPHGYSSHRHSDWPSRPPSKPSTLPTSFVSEHSVSRRSLRLHLLEARTGPSLSTCPAVSPLTFWKDRLDAAQRIVQRDSIVYDRDQRVSLVCPAVLLDHLARRQGRILVRLLS